MAQHDFPVVDVFLLFPRGIPVSVCIRVAQDVYQEAETLQARLRGSFRMPTTSQQQHIARLRQKVNGVVQSLNSLWR